MECIVGMQRPATHRESASNRRVLWPLRAHQLSHRHAPAWCCRHGLKRKPAAARQVPRPLPAPDRAHRDRSGHPRKVTGNANIRTDVKADVMQEVLGRFEAQFEKVQSTPGQASKKAPAAKRAPGKADIAMRGVEGPPGSWRAPNARQPIWRRRSCSHAPPPQSLPRKSRWHHLLPPNPPPRRTAPDKAPTKAPRAKKSAAASATTGRNSPKVGKKTWRDALLVISHQAVPPGAPPWPTPMAPGVTAAEAAPTAPLHTSSFQGGWRSRGEAAAVPTDRCRQPAIAALALRGCSKPREMPIVWRQAMPRCSSIMPQRTHRCALHSTPHGAQRRGGRGTAFQPCVFF